LLFCASEVLIYALIASSVTVFYINGATEYMPSFGGAWFGATLGMIVGSALAATLGPHLNPLKKFAPK
jgi:hypothetical protein